MSRDDRILCLLFCALFGLIGGAVSNLGFLGLQRAEAQPNSAVTTAQHFVVVDAKGNRLAELGNDNGSAALSFYSESKARSRLTNQSLYFFDGSGGHRIGLGVFRPTGQVPGEGNYSALTLWDAKGKQTYEAK